MDATAGVRWLHWRPTAGSFRDALDWLQHPKVAHVEEREVALLVVLSIERLFFDTWRSGRALPLDELAALVEVVERYRAALAAFLESLEALETAGLRALSRVELLSRELLVVWVGYCLVHRSTGDAYPVVRQYGVAPRWQDLRHLVLADRTAQTVALEVCAYLKASGCEQPLFSLDLQEPTLRMAETVAAESETIRSIWAQEQRDAENRRQVHWETVRMQQAEVRRLEPIRADLEREEKERERDAYYCNRRYRHCIPEHAALQSVRERLRNVEYQLQEALRPPAPVLQPLPQSESQAMRVLFFLHMPDHFQLLSRMSLTAQQMLLPKRHTVAMTAVAQAQFEEAWQDVQVPDAPTSWVAYYNRHTDLPQAAENAVRVRSYDKPPPESEVRLRDVMCYRNHDDGVWHPDQLQPTMQWYGGDFALDRFPLDQASRAFDPAKLQDTHRTTADYFTERFPGPDCERIQWTLVQYGQATASSRGNRTLTSQDAKPAWLTKPQFISFAGLRAYPRQQLRKLCAALRTRALPLGHPGVAVLVRQALYHGGDVTVTRDATTFAWKADLDEGEAAELLHAELDGLARELRDAPRQYRSLLLLAELATYLSQFHAPSRDIARRFAHMTEDWGRALEEQIDGAAPQHQFALRAKQCLFFMYSLACYRFWRLDKDDIRTMCGLAVQSQSLRHFEDPTPFEGELASLAVLCRHVMLSRAPDILPRVLDGGGAILTKAVRTVLHDTPRDLRWRRLNAADTGCFEAVSADKQLYSINVLTGVVLVNGLPPGRLPRGILEHPLYRRTFRDRDFETVVKADGTLATARAFDGCFYTFAYDATTETLEILEVDAERHELRLLDPDQSATWGPDLPARLQRLHSHWYSRARRAVLLRPLYFRCREVHFFLEYDGPPEVTASWACWRVPETMWARPWAELSLRKAGLDRLVLQDPTVAASVLRKFERRKYTHTYVSPDGAMRVSFPRYELEFERRGDGRFHSMNYAGYRLAGEQQLEDTLLQFHAYLVLEHVAKGSDDVLVLVPAGRVSLDQDGVSIRASEACDAARACHVYDVHPRFRHLMARDRLGRLQLAALYAATGTALPEPRLRMTGEEVAMVLVRQSWGNWPLDPSEKQQLGDVARYCQHSPGAVLLCHELLRSSGQLEFLHQGTAADGAEPLPEGPELLPVAELVDAETEYLHSTHPLNVRQALTADEEQRLMGRHHTRHAAARMQPRYGTLPPVPSPVVETFVEDAEERLQELLVQREAVGPVPEFPLEPLHNSTTLSRQMDEDLRRSWAVHHDAPRIGVSRSLSDCATVFRELQAKACDARCALEDHLEKVLQQLPATSGTDSRSRVVAILRESNRMPKPQLLDLMRMACEPQLVHEYNPFLSKGAEEAFRKDVLLWLQICVLEDKLHRLLELSCDDAADPEELVQVSASQGHGR